MASVLFRLPNKNMFILSRKSYYLRQRPYHVEHTSSRPITEVKQRRAQSYVLLESCLKTVKMLDLVPHTPASRANHGANLARSSDFC